MMCQVTLPAGSKISLEACKKTSDEATLRRNYARAIRFHGESCELARKANTQADLRYRKARKDAAPKAAKKEAATVTSMLGKEPKKGSPGARTAGDKAVRGTKVG